MKADPDRYTDLVKEARAAVPEMPDDGLLRLQSVLERILDREAIDWDELRELERIVPRTASDPRPTRGRRD